MKPFNKRLQFAFRILLNPYIITNLSRLRTIDGGGISPFSIFLYMVKALYRFPGFYDYRVDVRIKGMTELVYLILSTPERMKKMRESGYKFVGKWAVNPTDIYFGSRVSAIDPFFFAFCRMIAVSDNSYAVRGRAQLSPDACPAQAAAYTVLSEDIIKLDFFYPFIGPWCYDSQYCFESLRSKLKGVFGEQPYILSERQRGISKDFMLSELRKFVIQIEELTGEKYDPEFMRKEIKLENELRGIIFDIQNMMLEDRPPLASLDLILATFISGDWLGDPLACMDVLCNMRDFLKKRLRNNESGWGLKENPIRILITGIAWGDLGLYNILDDLGGVIVGSECVMSNYMLKTREDGDPLENLAERFINTPYTFNPGEKARWTVNNIKRMKRVDGVVFNCNFGCNYNATASRIIIDSIKEQLDIPVLLINSDLPGENHGQMRTRFGAFFEMIRKKRKK
ncbi:MAG: 2-hydroxyacyl-CoA dehydratase family protein [bacterium]